MKEMIRSEFYRLRLNKSCRIAAVLIPGLLVAVGLFFRFYYHVDSFGANFRCLIGMLRYILPVTIVFQFNLYEEYRYHTIKNICTIHKKTDIYLGKLVVQLAVNVTIFVVSIAIYFIVSLFVTDRGIGVYDWQIYLGSCILALLILVHNTVLVDLLMIICRNEIVFIVSYVILTNVFSLLVDFIPIGSRLISGMLISEQLLYLQTLNFNAGEWIQNICMSLGGILIYGIAGCFALKHLEAK